MNKISKILVIGFFFLQGFVFGQEIIDVPDEWNGNAIGAINNFIMGDTTETGERAHPNAIYRLQRGKVYFQDNPMLIDFNFTLIADDDDPNNPTRPPMIARAKNSAGNYPDPFMSVNADSITIKFKNILFQGMAPDEQIGTIRISLLEASGSKVKIISENCVYNYITGDLFKVEALDNSSVILTDNVFRNNARLSSYYSGYVLVFKSGVRQDSIVIVNNTFFNNSGYVLYLKDFPSYVELVHNTIFNHTKAVLRLPLLINGVITDNIIYNYFTYGADSAKFADKQYAIAEIAEIDSAKLAELGINQEDRRILYRNNVYSWNHKILEYWADSNLVRIPWMAEGTLELVDKYDGFINDNNIEADPGFDPVMADTVSAKQVAWAIRKRLGEGEWPDRLYYPDGKLFDLAWPLIEDLTYTNDSLLTFAQGGFPVGDLNWYPDQKAQWEKWVTAIDNNDDAIAPKKYVLNQNYPNPFNPVTTISFSLPKSGLTELSIYNILGQKVATVVNKELAAGQYKFRFKAGNLSSGLYFYKLKSNDFEQIKKMMLLK